MPISRSDPEPETRAGREDDTGVPVRGPGSYDLDAQIGYLLRRAYQRNSLIFAEQVPGPLTPTQFSVMHRLAREGAMSQNRLGRSVAMDGATTKGVVDRLIARGLVKTERDAQDRRRHLVSLTADGSALIASAEAAAARVSAETLAPLRERERETLLRLLKKIL
ncbi:MarR family winged helix-turn-helix transcriptional regulator [Sulfitobacter sp. D35]|uniref:MarR family winged helix-turn-helix transcriptional regulator n=1 Tax=Sulfitobacter sp. D35 TaxID=3083252 RepID=UPI00296EED1F|nr:MarR family winged helix-turn-helix transcriptional regulator [Sulfitobacter sp. D35]MDW4498526.1 MarR family winged helix-turn-helix transcriptional regulator [Sulfitobacter sp. D35]